MSEQVQQSQESKKDLGFWATVKSLIALVFKGAKVVDTAVDQVYLAQHQLVKEQRQASSLTKEDIKSNKELLDSLWD